MKNDAGMILNTFALMMLIVISVYAFTMMRDGFFEQKSINGSSSPVEVVSASSYGGISGKASGEIIKLSSVGDDWIVNFKEDLSDYKFTGVDTTELYLLQYAFENHESVTVTYTVVDDMKTLEGITVSSPELPLVEPIEPVPTDVKKDEGEFAWWLIPVWAVGPSISIGFLLYNRRHQRRVREMIRGFEERDRTVHVEARVTGKRTVKKEKEEETVEETVPLDSRYRIERAETLLDERGKNRRYKKQKKKEK